MFRVLMLAYKSFLSKKSHYEYEKYRADVDLSLALKKHETVKLKIRSAITGLRAANSTYAVIKNKFENGLVDNVNYLQALNDRFNAQSSLSAAKYNLEIKKAYVMNQEGKNIWEYVK